MFIDGVGLGKAGPDNPLSLNFGKEPFLGFMTNGNTLLENTRPFYENDHLFKSIDACLGVEGLPQSGTGQTALFSGSNASKRLGRHFGPYPHSKIKPLLGDKSLFGQLKDMGKNPFFMNAFPDIFFELARKRNRWSCCTLMTRNAGIRLNSINEVLAGKALTAEILQDAWKERLNLEVPEITLSEAARRVVMMAQHYDLVLVEFYLTDKAGHSQDLDYAYRILNRLNGFISEIIKIKPGKDSFMITSDHGNIEDLSTKTHTRNNVPLLVNGPAASYLRDAESILDVTPSILKMFDDV